nr:PREDICTED: uncharacterized protein LOC109038303 [Bemisia tabaci]
MLVKLAAILIIAGLLGDSRAAALESQNQISNLRVKSGWYRLGTPVSDDSNMIPDFSFSKVIALLKTFLMNASQGSLNNTQLSNFKNTTLMTVTRQSVTELGDFPVSMTTAEQMVEIVDLKAIWNQTEVLLGLLKAEGELVALLSGTAMKLVMTATSSGNGTCQIDIQMVLQKLGLDLDFSQLPLGILLQVVVSILSFLVSALGDLLSPVLGPLLTILVGNLIEQEMDSNYVCTLMREIEEGQIVPLPLFPL